MPNKNTSNHQYVLIKFQKFKFFFSKWIIAEFDYPLCYSSLIMTFNEVGILFCETPCVRLAHTNGRPYETNMFQSCLGCNTMLPRNCYFDLPYICILSKVDTLWCLWSSSMFAYFSKPLYSPKRNQQCSMVSPFFFEKASISILMF